MLVDVEGYSVEEAAGILDCPTGTVKSRCARGRARLARLLRERGITGTSQPAGTSDQQDRNTREEPQGGAGT